ncbi:metal ABC transporter ATP-binding protein [Lysinibacter sp. HNR]|uniref:metal ABC transporter ATP-binding protein n=1 Tax=Lysinibacter sp. HNR TaxID=3031408 RepID=UPI0024354BC5|nr:metal ABC transporter ATP-binding protein [Lysinibacter sp. HNR]WGD38452.1 metal ABC transporter ATP-binding protein [Lysinibacter sp. HNR]
MGSGHAVAAVQVTNATVKYGSVIALKNADLELFSGRITGLAGVNGSGKSTLMKSILGLMDLNEGAITVQGGSVSDARRKAQIAYVAQSEAIDESFPLSVRQVIEMGRYGALGPLRMLKKSDAELCDRAMQRTGITHLGDRLIGELSGGQRKRVFLARAIAQQANIMLLDEPFSGVDITSQESIIAVIRSLAADGVSILVSSHDIASLADICDEVVLWYQRSLFSGPPETALSEHNLALAFTAGAEIQVTTETMENYL